MMKTQSCDILTPLQAPEALFHQNESNMRLLSSYHYDQIR